MNDLDWLARNVHEWPNDAIYGVNLGGNAGFSNAMAPVTLGESFTKDQWLARRAELQNNHNFTDNPDAKIGDTPIDEFYGWKLEDPATSKQQAPKGSGSPILGMVLADLTNRALDGKEKYGEPLLAHNGRRSVVDLLQELYDAAMYCRQLTEELGDLGGELESCIRAVAEVKCLEGEELARHVSLLKLISSKNNALLAR